MKFSTDHYFQIGHAHYLAGKPCQDYALSRSSGLAACAIVSDGCSTGGNTDVGSRMVSLATLQAIRDYGKTSSSNGSLSDATMSIRMRQQQFIDIVRPMFGLERDDMLATCIYIYATQSEALIFVQGDGVVAWKYQDGRTSLHRFEWAKNAPFYPSYDAEDAIRYIGNIHEGNAGAAIMSHSSGSEEVAEIPFDEGRMGIALAIPFADLGEIEYVAAFTDGVAQIGTIPNGDDLLDWRMATEGFLSFKSNAGEFAKRRMIRGIKDFQKVGKGPIDDIAYAVIRIESDEKGDMV